MFPSRVDCFEVITYPLLLAAPGGGFFKTLSCDCELFVGILIFEEFVGPFASVLVGTKGFGERLLLNKVDFSNDVVEFETDFSVETVMKEDGEDETVFVVEEVVELDDDFEVELFTNFDIVPFVVVDPVVEDFGEGELLLPEEGWGLVVTFGPGGLFTAGLG